MTFWVYKLTYDTGAAPHVRDGLLSLAICKPRIRAGAARGDVIFGFAGRSRAVNRGERLIYIAEVTDKLETPGEYYERAEYRDRWDCIYARRGERLVWRPGSLFHRDGSSADTDLGPAPMYPRAVVLISNEFRYMGAEGTMEYARRWPNLGTLVHERGIGELQVEPDSPTGRMLSALRQEIWRTRSADRHGAPTEPALGPPGWSTVPESRAAVAPNRIGCGSPRFARGCAFAVPDVRSESSAPAKRTRY
jgi:hypothetical protein